MDLEGIGALSAAVVACIGIPASMLIGRWQMKAGLRAAEATSRAGLAQADSVYRAALDAVRAQADAAHLQWRRGIQREAYASFLLAANRVQELGEGVVMDNEEDLAAETVRAGKAEIDGALSTLKEAQTVIELEGPDDVAAPAAGMTEAAQLLGYHLRKQATYERAWGRLGRLLDNQSPDVNSAAARLMESLANLRPTGPAQLDGTGGRDALTVRTAERACHDAWSALPLNALADSEYAALLEGWSSRPPTSSSSYLDAERLFREKEAQFVLAAKIELHGRPAS